MASAGTVAVTDGRGERWAAHRETRRAQILDAALSVIESAGEGEEIHVRQIAQEAGLGRAVIYRHFADRADLDREIQRHILDQLVARLAPEFNLSGSIAEIIDRIVRAYVTWADQHPALHRIGAAESQDSERLANVMEATGQIGGLITMLVTSGANLLEVDLSEQDLQLLDPLVFGIVGQAVGTVRFWLAAEQRQPSVDVLAQHLARSVWFQIAGHARDRGVTLDPDMALEELVLASARAD